jgi:hypothetical protein
METSGQLYAPASLSQVLIGCEARGSRAGCRRWVAEAVLPPQRIEFRLFDPESDVKSSIITCRLHGV